MNNHFGDNIFETLAECSERDTIALQILAAAYCPLTCTILNKVLKETGYHNMAVNSAWRNKLGKKELIIITNGRFRCAPRIVDSLAQKLALSKLYINVIKAIDIALTHDSHGRNFSKMRESRTSLYTANAAKTRGFLDTQQDHFSLCKQYPQAYVSLLEGELNWDWFATLADDIRFQLLHLMMRKIICNLSVVDTTLAEIKTELESSPKILKQAGGVCLLAEICVWQGEVHQAEKLLEGIETEKAWSLRARLAFLRGQDAAALEIYDTILIAQKNKASKGELICLDGEDFVFYLLCFLRQGQFSEFRKQSALAKKVFVNGRTTNVVLWLERVIDVREMRATLTIKEASAIFDEQNNGDILFLWLFISGLHWLDLQLDKTLDIPSAILALVMHATHHEIGWLAWEISSSPYYAERSSDPFINKMKEAPSYKEMIENNRKHIESMDLVSCLNLLKKEEVWERGLHALMNLNASSVAQNAHDSQRMAWLITTTHKGKNIAIEDIEPRLQKRNKNGKWSKGRKVALSRLLPTPVRNQELPFLNEQDKMICSCIKEEQVYEWYHHETSTEVNIFEALPVIAEHPLLFIGDTSIPFSVIKGEIVLQVLKEKENIRLRIEPFPDKKGIFSDDHEEEEGEPTNLSFLRWETPQRVVVYTLESEHLHIANILGEKGLLAPKEAEEQALGAISAIAPFLTVHSEIGGEGQQAAEVIEADARLHMHLQPIGQGLQLSCFVRPFGDAAPLLMHPAEGGETLFTEHEGRTLQSKRNLRDEEKRSQKLFSECAYLSEEEGWSWKIDDPQETLETLDVLQGFGDDLLLEWPEGKGISLAKKMDVGQFRVSMNKKNDWFEMQGEIEISENQVISLQQLMSLMQASPGRFVRLDNDQFISLSKALYERLDALQSITDKGRFHGLAAGAVDELTDGMKIRKNKNWQDHLSQLDEAQNFQPTLPSTLQAELRDYQQEGFAWMARLAYWGAGACLADDMGLGKTVQALALILSHALKGPTLVIAPTSVCMNWEAEASRFAPTLNLKDFAEGDRTVMINEAGPFDLIVCSYALLQRNGALLASREWQTVVLDEAQAIKNNMTKRSKAAMELNSAIRLITTGTPIENHLGELWTLFQFINPGLLGSLDSFNRRFANPIQLHGDKDIAKRLRQLIHPFMLRRLKSDVLKELPSRTEITMHIDLSPEELALYEATRRQALERIQQSTSSNPGEQQIRVLAEIMRLRRACCHPSLVMPGTKIVGSKLTAFGECIEELRENNHKALVFSQFVAHLHLLRKHLDDKGISYQYLDGSTPAAQRKKRVDAFQAGEGDVFLISLKAGGSGLNLTAADYVLHMDPWWNPAVEDQASDRAHRIGQKRPVTIYRFIAKNTIEDKIVQMHQQKRDLANTLLEGSDGGSKISLQEIMKLVEESAEG
ncbi:MAG: DEAD/DEAH box helicase [Mariprofundaceae bacterium]|nr:DEAD/DEAH box helicase [Mariprofundaceae bacterium]